MIMLGNKEKFKMTVFDTALIGIMIAVIEVCKFVMAPLPNIELTSFWLIMFTLYFDKRVYFVVPALIIIEGAVFGFGLWWIMYLYAWPLLVIVTTIFKKSQSAVTFSLISGIFGLCFGLMCSVPYVFINTTGTDFANGIRAAFAWWVAGIPFDLLHGGGNFILMMILYTPVSKVMKKTNQKILTKQTKPQV